MGDVAPTHTTGDADHRRTIAAPESCCDNTINLHQKNSVLHPEFQILSGEYTTYQSPDISREIKEPQPVVCGLLAIIC